MDATARRRAEAAQKKREKERAKFVEKAASIEKRRQIVSLEGTFAEDATEDISQADAHRESGGGELTGYGLMSKAEFAAQRVAKEQEAEKQRIEKEKRAQEEKEALARAGEKRRRAAAATLSFTDGDDEEEQEEEVFSIKKRKTRVAPESAPLAAILPDSRRAHEEELLREKFRKEFLEREEALKKEKIEITYSYWDGSGHRRDMRVPRGATIGTFLRWVIEDLRPSFPELRMVAPGDLLFVKEDVIVPHPITFHDLIASKIQGKTGPLFRFDLENAGDADAHPAKVVDSRWYNRNKHLFPASLWKPLELNKS